MQRKIIKQGHNTLTITLPVEWARRFNLGSGKEVDLIEKDNGLFISVEKHGEQKKTEIDIAGMDIPTIWKYFMAVYREGYTEIKVKFNPEIKLEHPYKFLTQHRFDQKYRKDSRLSVIESLQAITNRFIGFEIVEHGKDHIIIKEMGELTNREFDNSLRRVFLLIQQMFEDTISAIEKNDADLLSNIHDVDINVDKFQDYCIRILNRTANKDTKKTSLLFNILFLLELLGDEFKNISHHFMYDLKNEKFSVIAPMAKSVKEQFDLFYELYYKFDIKKIEKMSTIDAQRYLEVNNLYKKVKNEEVKEIFHHLRIITRYLNALSELRIEMEF